MRDLPTILFIPGSWHKPSCYNKITGILQEERELQCVSLTLPTTTGDPAKTFKDDVDAARQAISTETAKGNNVVVVAHSYGGMIGNSAIKGFTRPQGNAAQSKDIPSGGHVIGLILIATGFTLTGLSFMDPLFGHPPPAWRVNKTTGYAEIVVDPCELFYHDLPREEAEYWTSQLTTQSLRALFEGGEYAYAGWQEVPVWYIGTVEDRGLPVVLQRMQVGMAREMGGVVQHRELQTSHSPFLSQPGDTTRIMLEALEAFLGAPGEAQRKAITFGEIIPEPRLTKPLTWFRYGLPLTFGRIIGRLYLIFQGGRRLWRGRD